MQTLTLETLIAVLEETFGSGIFWSLIIVALIVLALYIYVLIRDRHIGWKKFLVAQLFMPLGAILAVWFVMALTHSGISDIGGPIDLIIFLGIASMGAIGIAILVYTVEALMQRHQKPE